jgi:hypothetical protein
VKLNWDEGDLNDRIVLFSRLKYSINKITFMSEKLMLRREYKLIIFENRVLGNIFAPNMKEVTGASWNFTVDIHDLYS